MAKLTVKLSSYGREPRTVEAEFVLLAEMYGRPIADFGGDRDPYYDVFIDGERVGHIHRVLASTDRNYGRIRVPGKGRPAWSWLRYSDGKRNPAGLYPHNRAAAVADLLGYDSGEVVR